MLLFTNLLKAAVSVAITPVALVADVARLPSTAYNGKDAFGLTGSLLKNAGQYVKEATKPEK